MYELRVLDGLHQGAALPLFGEQWSIGAHADADLVLSDPGIAEHHAHLHLIDACWSVQAKAGLLSDSNGQVLAQIGHLPLNALVSVGGVCLCVSLAEQPWPQPSVPRAVPPASSIEPPRPLMLSSISSVQQKRLLSLVLVCAVVIMVVGMVSSGERTAQASLMPSTPSKTELASPFEVRQILLKMLNERELGQHISLQVINGQIALDGLVTQDDVELVARMLIRFGEQFETAVPVMSRVRVRDSTIPFKILQIVSGPNGHVVLETGDRLFVGDEIDGLRLVLIDNSKVVFDGEQRYEVRW